MADTYHDDVNIAAGSRTDAPAKPQKTSIDTGLKQEDERRKKTDVDSIGDQKNRGFRRQRSRIAQEFIDNIRDNQGNQRFGEPLDNRVDIDSIVAEILACGVFHTTDDQVYRIIGQLQDSRGDAISGGESILFLCQGEEEEQYVSKVYLRDVPERPELLAYMKTSEALQYTLAILDAGIWENNDKTRKFYFEITQYCPQGDLSSAGPMELEEIKKVVECMNDALHSLHRHGLVHADVKCENMFRVEENGITRYLLGDFGVTCCKNAIASLRGTTGYFAPELLVGAALSTSSIYREECDYYSLGIAIASLYRGEFVFSGYTDREIETFKNDYQIPLDDRAGCTEVKNLVLGLVQIDKNQRFGHKDIIMWLRDQGYDIRSKINAQYNDGNWPNPFRIISKVKVGEREVEIRGICHNERELFEFITEDSEHWEIGKKYLFEGKFTRDLPALARGDLADYAQECMEEYRNGREDKGLSAFLKGVYPEGPIVWKGKTFRSLRELGDSIHESESLKEDDYFTLFQEKVLSDWISSTSNLEIDKTVRDDQVKLIQQIEKMSVNFPELATFWFMNVYASEKSKGIAAGNVKFMSELLEQMFRSPREFYMDNSWCDKLLDRKTLGAELYGFLYGLGYQEKIDVAWKEIDDSNCDLFERICKVFVLLDSIATEERVDRTGLYAFFLNFGPAGIATCVQRLVREQGENVYQAMDDNGRRALYAIAHFEIQNVDSVEKYYEQCMKLMDHVNYMRSMLQDNPYLLEHGVFEEKGVICKNRMGGFYLNIFERQAPLYFMSLIESH